MSFFGVEVRAVRIGDSPAAPLFRLAVAPNLWSKQVQTAPVILTETQAKYVQYWKPLLEELNNTHGWNIKTENRYSYYTAGSGMGYGQFVRMMRFTDRGEARVELWIQNPSEDWNKAAFDILKESQGHLESEFGPMNWERLNNAKSSRVGVSRSGSIDDSDEELAEIRDWMIEHVTRFPTAFQPYVEAAWNRLEDTIRKLSQA